MKHEKIVGHFKLKIKIGGIAVAQIVGDYTINVNPSQTPPLALDPASGPLPAETVGQPAQGKIAISGGTPPYNLVSANGLPPGVSAALGADGASVELGGSPSQAGLANVEVTVADSGT